MINDSTLLKAWEQAYGKPPFLRALILLEVVNQGSNLDALMAMPVGQRDASLLKLRQMLFGTQMETVADCDACGETLEFGFTTDDMLQEVDWSTDHHSLNLGDREFQYRLPNSADLARISHVPPKDRSDSLVRGCVIQRDSDPTELNDSDLKLIAEAIAESDPQSDIQIDLSCAACNSPFVVQFDIVSFLWAEVNAWAERLLTEIHTLAKVYHWTEAEILRLSTWRRQVYLNMVRQ